MAMEGGTPKTPTMTRQRQALMGLPKKALSKPFVRTFFLTWLACDTRCYPMMVQQTGNTSSSRVSLWTLSASSDLEQSHGLVGNADLVHDTVP